MNAFLNSKKSIFKTLIIGKIILLPIIYLALNYFDLRENSLFFHADLTRYEESKNILDLFKLGTWVSNVGYMIFIAFIKSITSIESIRKIIYSLVSLITITYSQSIILNIVFSEKRNINSLFKYFSILLSLLNFYILIYSFRPGTDVFGCLGVAILIESLIKSKKSDIKDYYFLNWFFVFLVISLFRNTLILIIPCLFFTKIFKRAKTSFLSKGKLTRFVYILILSLLILINIYQFIGATSPFNDQQITWGFATLENEKTNYFSLNYLKDLFVFLISKFIFLISARESVGMTGNWLINLSEENILSGPVVANVMSAIVLFSINIFGLTSIFKKFSNTFRNSFVFSLIPLLPLISYVTHHRYFLPYSLITSACLPFLFEKFKPRIIKS